MTNVCTFRLDDITPDMDWNRFYRVKAIFDKYKVKPLIGVVPDNQDDGLKCGEFHEDFWEYVVSLEKSGWTIAQHGYRHIYETDKSGILGIKKASELELQLNELKKELNSYMDTQTDESLIEAVLTEISIVEVGVRCMRMEI